MKVILLAAGLGTRLKPLTDISPKSLLQISDGKTVIERTIELINHNCTCEIVVVVGYKKERIAEVLSKYHNCTIVSNPFYRVTNSIASLWFAREHLDDEVVIFNSDVIISEMLLQFIIESKHQAAVFYDSSITTQADYKVAQQYGKVVVMSNELREYSGEYVGITKLNKTAAAQLRAKIENMLNNELYNEWYETALVDMIFEDQFQLEAVDVSEFEWTEIDNVNDLIKAKQIVVESRILRKIRKR